MHNKNGNRAAAELAEAQPNYAEAKGGHTASTNRHPAPEPLFTTDDSFASASRKLIWRKNLLDA
jgi:hypothetical protein